MLWQQMKGILSLQLVRDVRQSKNFWKVLGQRVQPKSQWARQAICARHALNRRIFFLSQYRPTPRKTTEQTEILNLKWYILVYLRVQLSCQVLTLTLRSKGRVLTSVTSCYQPSFEATIQLTNFLWFIVYFVVLHSLDYCEVTQDSQLLTSLRFIWKLMKLNHVEVVSPAVRHSKKVLTICSRQDHCHLERIMHIWSCTFCRSPLGRIWLPVGRQARNSRGNRPAVVWFHGVFDLHLASSWTHLWNLHQKNSKFFIIINYNT